MLNVILKELKELVRDDRIKIVVIISLILLLIALITGSNQYQKSNQQLVESVSKERDIWETQDEKNPHSAAHYGTYAFKPKFALSLLDYGVTKYTGNSIFLEAHNRNDANFSEASDQTSLTRFGTLSINFVLIYLFPLIIILTGYNCYTKELENKTLTLLKSQGVYYLKLVLGKLIATFFPVFVLTILVFFISGILLSNLNGVEFFSWTSLLVFFTSYLIYYLIISTLTVLVSVYSESSGKSLVGALAIWILFSFITPKIATNIANEYHPYPSKLEFSNGVAEDKKNGLDGHNPWNKAAKQLEEETLKKYNVNKISQLPFNYSGFRMQKGEEHEAEIYTKHYNNLNEIAQRQNSVYQKLSFLSPFISLRFLSMDISNTSDQLHWKFTNDAENYRLNKQQFLNFDIKDNSKYGDRGYKMNSKKFKQLPKFSFIPPSLSEIINQNIQNILFLLLWFILPFTGLLIYSKNR